MTPSVVEVEERDVSERLAAPYKSLKSQQEEAEEEVPPTAKRLFESLWSVPGLYRDEDDIRKMVLWNYEKRRFGRPVVAWQPVSIYFVPRRVWVLRLDILDPFYPSGHQVLVVDKESMLPSYKLSYDQSGAFQKISMGLGT